MTVPSSLIGDEGALEDRGKAYKLEGDIELTRVVGWGVKRITLVLHGCVAREICLLTVRGSIFTG